MGDVSVRLTRKLAEMVDGVDLRDHKVGDVFTLSLEEARLLIAEQWAEPAATRTEKVTRCTSQRRTPHR
jgi:hypothetical protein